MNPMFNRNFNVSPVTVIGGAERPSYPKVWRQAMHFHFGMSEKDIHRIDGGGILLSSVRRGIHSKKKWEQRKEKEKERAIEDAWVRIMFAKEYLPGIESENERMKEKFGERAIREAMEENLAEEIPAHDYAVRLSSLN